MHFSRLFMVLLCMGVGLSACTKTEEEAPNPNDTPIADGGEGSEPDPVEVDVPDPNEEENIDVSRDSELTCDGNPETMRSRVAGRAILCGFDHDEGMTGNMKNLDDHEGEDDAPEPVTLYRFNPSGWDLDSLAGDEDGVLSYQEVSDFVYEQGLLDNVTDSEEVVRELSDSFVRDIIDTTHGCLQAYLQPHYEVDLDCLDQTTPTIECDATQLPSAAEEGACVDHNGSVADWVRSYVTTVGALTDNDERELYENILSDSDFSSSILEGKITVGDLHFYQYFYAKRDLDLVDANGNPEVYSSFLNPNNWASYPLVAASTPDDCAGSDVPRCCEYETFINTYDSSPWDLMAQVNDCTNQFPDLGPYENSQLYKHLLNNDGSVGNDGAFTIDEFFRPFILHYEKTTAPENRGLCYWSELRFFAFEMIAGEAGNAAVEMNAYNMDNYIQLYNSTIAAYEGTEPEEVTGVCEQPEG